MLFNSLKFLIFFPIVALVYFIIPAKIRYIWLLIASYYFYMSWNAKYALLMGTSTVITYFGARLIERCQEKNVRKLILICSVAVNLLILLFFKYFGFLIDTLNFVGGSFGFHLNNNLQVLLPVGISFYTFQALGYIIDVYRGETKAEHNVLKYALFVSFFPQLVAGPIERSKNLLSQIDHMDEIKRFDFERIQRGLLLVVYGLFLKMCIADRAAVIVDNIYAAIENYGSFDLIVATIAFSVQIYCDFASYSIIAIGSARVLGIRLMENFNTPYLSENIKDFWRRWHISLSQWFRDYLYIPLGGNRCTKARQYLNILLTFLCSGLWHGANWTFVIWGGMHGVFQIISDATKPLRNKLHQFLDIDETTFGHKLLNIAVTYGLVCVSWVFFRADNVQQAIKILCIMMSEFDPMAIFSGTWLNFGLDKKDLFVLIFSLLLLAIFDLVKYHFHIHFDEVLLRQNYLFRCMILIGLVVFILVFGMYGIGYDAKTFIYFQF